MIAFDDTFIAFENDSNGLVTVSGTGSRLDVVGGAMGIGVLGNGTLNILDGAVVDASQLVGVGSSFSSGVGVVNVDASDSRFEIGDELILGVSGGGTGFLNVTNGGVVNAVSSRIGFSGGAGAATINGVGSHWNHSGQLVIGDNGSGTLTALAGAVVTSDLGTIGSGSTGLVTIEGDGSRWDNNGLLTVGNSGTGTLRINSGGVVTNTGAIVANNSDSGGEVIVDGEGSRWQSSGSLVVGNRGDGGLRIRQGGVVSSGSGRLGTGADGRGTVFVNDSGSLWQLAGDLIIGENSLSSLDVDRGVVNSINGTIGKNVGGSNSNATVREGGQWNNSGARVVGLQGNGGLVIASGGSVSSSSGIIGLSARGLVAIDGVGSSWTSSGDLIVGDEGEAKLGILTGAIMSNVNGVIGKTTDSISAEVAVNGQWSNSGDLTVSSGGNASLEISGGGLVTVGGTTAIGTNGTVSLSSGRFEFGTTTLPEFNRITATGGSMSGRITHSDFSDVASLTSLQNFDVELNDVTLENSGTLFGNASLNTSLSNTTNGEVEAAIGERMRFTGSVNRNDGEFNLFGGQVRFDQDLTNSDSGFIGGNGVLIANGGLTNQGVMAFSGTTDILGDVENTAGGQIVTSGGSTMTFFDDLVHNGAEIRTSAGSNTVIFARPRGQAAIPEREPCSSKGICDRETARQSLISKGVSCLAIRCFQNLSWVARSSDSSIA